MTQKKRAPRQNIGQIRSKEAVAKDIRAYRHTGRINFCVPGRDHFYICYEDYKFIADLVEKGHIRVFSYDYRLGNRDVAGKKSAGVYMRVGESKIQISRGSDQRKRLSTLIHECTHAIQDDYHWHMNSLDAESMAHIAQAILLVQIKAKDLYTMNPRIEAAIRCAYDVLRSRKGGIDRENYIKLRKRIGEVYDNEMRRYNGINI